MTSHPVRLLVVDDHGIVRKGICALLAQVADMRVIGEASEGETTIDQLWYTCAVKKVRR
jgi:DNA-binding NarL/FixJ family response regulator